LIDRHFRRAVIPLALFFGTFAWSFVYVSLPFYVQRLSGGGAASTLRWTGWILGVTPLLTLVMAPVWGRLAGPRDPKLFYVAVQSLQGLAFFGMTLARSLGELLAVRLVLGLVGASSALLLCLAPLTSVWAFGAVRFVQVLCVAPLFPIVVTGIVRHGGGEVIGLSNGARLAPAFVGPVLATSVLAWMSPAILYVAVAALGLGCVPLVGRGWAAGQEAMT